MVFPRRFAGASWSKVTIYERMSHVGGRTSTFSDEGFRFRQRSHILPLPPGVAGHPCVCWAGLFEEIPMVRLDPQYRLMFGAGGELLATCNLERLRTNIAALSPHDAEGFARFYDDNRRKLAALRRFSRRHFWAGKTLRVLTFSSCCRYCSRGSHSTTTWRDISMTSECGWRFPSSQNI